MSTNMQYGALLERYNLDREAARTGPGVLYEATEKVTHRKVAIEIANELDDDARLEFERDAMIAQRLEGDHVLRVLEVGALIDGTPFVVREPALGSLANDVAARGPLPTTEAVAWTLEVCEALAEAHTRGIAHGDIRAETVFLGRDAAGNPIAKVRWTSKAKAEGAAREDVARDIAGAAVLLRFLITGQNDVDDDAVKTLPTELGHAVARATSKNDDNRYRNIGELASALARYAPPDHQSARNIASILSRSGIVGSPAPIPISQRMTAPNPVIASQADVISAAPPSSRRVPISARGRGEPGLNEEWFAPPPTRPRRSLMSDLPPPPPRKSGAFAAVALLLLGATLGGTLYLYKNHELPQWSGTAPPSDEGKMEPVSRTEVTSGLMDTTVMTTPAALEGAVIGQEEKKAVTTRQDDIEVTESAPAAAPQAAPQPPTEAKPAEPKAPAAKNPALSSGPTMPPAKPKAKTTTTTTSEDEPAKPWAGTGAPATPTTPSPNADDTTTPSSPSTAPTTSPTTAPTTAPTESMPPTTREPREDPGF
jgi:hypothetical protein